METRRHFRRFKTDMRRPVKAVLSRAKSRYISMGYLRAVSSPKAARGLICLSLKTLSEELSRLSGEVVTKNRARHFEDGCSPVTEPMRRAYGTLLANYLTRAMGREVAVTLEINSPWRITPYAPCARCGTWFEMRMENSRRCSQCARRSP